MHVDVVMWYGGSCRFVASLFVTLSSLMAESWSFHCIKFRPSGSYRIFKSYPFVFRILVSVSSFPSRPHHKRVD